MMTVTYKTLPLLLLLLFVLPEKGHSASEMPVSAQLGAGDRTGMSTGNRKGEPRPGLANLAFAFGICQILSPVALFVMAMMCLGGCLVYTLAVPAALFVLLGIATLWISLKALAKIRAGTSTSGKGKAIFGLVMGMVGTGFAVFFFLHALG